MFTACLVSTFCPLALAVTGDNGWQAGDNHRGTWAIASSCLSTIFACTWSVQHLNVGAQGDSKRTRWLRSVKWMIITILFPELIVLHAIFEFSMALQALRLMERSEKVEKVVKLPWWLPPSKQQKGQPSGSDSKDSKWTLTHCFLANMGGLYYCDRGQPQFPLTALQLAKVSGFKHPDITEEDIKDKSKQDWFAKGVAALQFLQLALSLLVRTNQGLAFSQLETVTLGFAVCGAVIYLVYLYKPQNVTTRTPLPPRNEPVQGGTTQQEMLQTEPTCPLRFEKTYDSFWDVLMNERSSKNKTFAKTDEECPEQSLEQTPERIPNDNIPISENHVAHPGVFFLAFASGLFGAMHAIAWNFEFPSTVERILWQTATVVAAGSPVVGLIAIPFAQLTVPAGDPQLFMQNCLRLMRELSWNASDKGQADNGQVDRRQVKRAYEELEKILAPENGTRSMEQRPYTWIFSEQNDQQALNLGRKLLTFLKEPETPGQGTLLLDLRSDKEFIGRFQRLLNLMEGNESKKLNDTAKTNFFPRESLLPKGVNKGILYATSILYCLARLSLLAIALSSLRQMPESVYVNTPWTAYIPTLGSSR